MKEGKGRAEEDSVHALPAWRAWKVSPGRRVKGDELVVEKSSSPDASFALTWVLHESEIISVACQMVSSEAVAGSHGWLGMEGRHFIIVEQKMAMLHCWPIQIFWRGAQHRCLAI